MEKKWCWTSLKIFLKLLLKTLLREREDKSLLGKKIVAKHIPDKGLESTIFAKNSKLNNKRTNDTSFRMGTRSEQAPQETK